MKDKLSQIQHRLRRQSLQNYFKERRIHLLQYRQHHSADFENSLAAYGAMQQQNNWKSMILNGITASQEEAYCIQPHRRAQDETDFEFKITSIEAGQYYLNILIDGAPYNYLEETINLLAKLINRVLHVTFKLTLLDQKIQNQIIYKCLQQIHYYITLGQDLMKESQGLVFNDCSKTKRILRNLLDDDYRALLQKEDSAITTEIINISYELCSSFMVYPNYQVVKYILTRVVTKDNLLFSQEEKRDKAHSAASLNQKIQELLMKFIMFLKPEEHSIRKTKSIHYLQVIHEYYTFIEYNLINIFEFIRNNEHPFDYQHINNALYFSLTLFTEIISKFKQCLNSINYEVFSNLLTLVKPSIIDQLYNITYMHSRSVIVERDKDEFILSIEQTISKVLRYVVEEKGRSRGGYGRNYSPWQDWQVDGNDRYLLDALTLIKRCLREAQEVTVS